MEKVLTKRNNMEARRSNVSRRRFTEKNQHTVWAEPKKSGGYIIYAGVKGTGKVTSAYNYVSAENLGWKLEKAKAKFNHRSN